MTIDDIKHNLSILTVLNHYNLTPDSNNRLTCSWHDDKTPSLQIYPKTNTWTCFSSKCAAGSGDVIDFIMKYEHITKHEALIKATELAGGDPDASVTTTKPKQGLSLVAILTKYYQGSLHSIQRSKKAQAYATERGLDYNKMNIGYCGFEIGKRWNEDLRKNAEEIGLFKIRNCLIFPMKNKDGQIVCMYGRAITKNPRVRHFYLKGGFKGLYPSYPKSDTKQLILTESIIDAATIKQHTSYEVIALYGTNGLTREHKEAIASLDQLEEIILFFDGDEAGKAAVAKYQKELKQLRPPNTSGQTKIKISHVNTPEGEDVNSLIFGHSPEILTHLIENRNFIFSTESRSLDTQIKKDIPPIKLQGKLNSDNPELLRYETNTLLITILGGIKITGLDRLRVTLKISLKDPDSNRDNYIPIRHSLDLYHANQVEQLTQKIAESLELGTTESEHTISHLTGELE